MLAIGLVHRGERPRHPPNARFDRGEAQLREALDHARSAQARHRLDHRRQRMRRIVDDGAAVVARGAWIAAGRDVEGGGQVAVPDQGPQRIEHRQVVVGMARVVGAPNRFARQGQAAKAEFRDPLDFGHRQIDIGGHDRRHRRHEIVVRAVRLPRPVVPHAALFRAEFGVLRREHRESLVGKYDLRVDTVAGMVANAIERVAPGVAAQAILPALRRIVLRYGAHARSLVALDHHPLVAFFIDFDVRQTVAELFVDALPPELARLVDVAVGRDQQVAVGIVGARGALPAFMPRRFESPAIFLIDVLIGLLDHRLSPCNESDRRILVSVAKLNVRANQTRRRSFIMARSFSAAGGVIGTSGIRISLVHLPMKAQACLIGIGLVSTNSARVSGSNL